MAVPNNSTAGINRLRSARQLLAQSPISIQIIERPMSVDAETSIKNKLYIHGSRMWESENDSSMTALRANPAQAIRFRCLDRKRLETMRLTTMETMVLHIVRNGSDR